MTKAVFKNKDGYITVDRTYKNYQLIGKTTQAATGGGRILGIGSEPWFWAVHSPEGVIYAPAYNPYNVNSSPDSAKNMWYLSRQCTFYHFGEKAFTKARPGLNLYDDSGNLFFSSNCQPMRVVDFVSGKFSKVDDIVDGKQIYQKTFKSGTYAVAIGQFPYRYWGTSRLYCFSPKITTTSTTVTIAMAKCGDTSSGSYRGNYYNLRYNFLVLDVSNY